MIIVWCTKGGSYIVAELDGSVWQSKIGAFRVIPYFARKKIDLPEIFDNIINEDHEILNEIENTGLEDSPDSRDYNFEGVNLDGSSLDESEDLEEFEESSDEGAWQFFYLKFEVFVLKFDLEKFRLKSHKKCTKAF